ncbi:MAG: hypothetical protein LQ351_008124 [Letrouitia transgressa]|nr:MAG: hypothetical protein LQ351_008124 [Letrouitia transgressa]
MSRPQVARLAGADRIARKTYEKQSAATTTTSAPQSSVMQRLQARRERLALEADQVSTKPAVRGSMQLAGTSTTSAPQSSVMQRLQARRERLATQAEQASKKPRPSSDPYATCRERIFAASSYNKSTPPPAPRQRVPRQPIDPFEFLVESLTFESRQSPTQRPRAGCPLVDSSLTPQAPKPTRFRYVNDRSLAFPTLVKSEAPRPRGILKKSGDQRPAAKKGIRDDGDDIGIRSIGPFNYGLTVLPFPVKALNLGKLITLHGKRSPEAQA